MSIADMGVSLFAAEKGYLQDIEVAKILDFEAALISYMRSENAELMSDIDATGNFNGDIEASLKEGIEKFKATQTCNQVGRVPQVVSLR